jgi:hypothetical protein
VLPLLCATVPHDMMNNLFKQDILRGINRLLSEEVEVNLGPTVSRPVCLGVRRPSGTCDRFFFLLEISFRQLRVCYFVAPSLTRVRVCNLLYNCFWALPEQSLLGRSPAELTTIFYCGGPGSRIYILQEQGGPVIPPGIGFPFCRLLRLAEQRWRYSNPLPHGESRLLSLHYTFATWYGTDRIHNTASHFYCCVSIRCHGLEITEPFPSNEKGGGGGE